MGSSNLGQIGNGSYGSSRRGKKSSSDKRKQIQRGLGVVQLLGYSSSLHSPFVGDLNKDLRVSLAHQSSPSSSSTVTRSSSLLGSHPNTMIQVGFGGSLGTEIRYGGLHPGATLRSLHDENDLLLPLHLLQPTVTLPLIEQSLENNRRRSDSISQNSDSSNSSELDLELTLSL